jgi:hypothetical protein
MAYLRIGRTRSYCSCDPNSSVDPDVTGHYENFAPEYHGSKEPCGEPWDYYVMTYTGIGPYKNAAIPYNSQGV